MLNPNNHIILCYVVRHGTTELNAGHCFRGHIDVPLDKQGCRDANKLASLFDNIDLSHIIASDKQRAMKTAQTIAERKDMKVHPTAALRPWDVGEFSGQPKNQENRDKLDFYVDH